MTDLKKKSGRGRPTPSLMQFVIKPFKTKIRLEDKNAGTKSCFSLQKNPLKISIVTTGVRKEISWKKTCIHIKGIKAKLSLSKATWLLDNK